MSPRHEPRRIGRHIAPLNLRRGRWNGAEAGAQVDVTDPLTMGHPARPQQRGARS